MLVDEARAFALGQSKSFQIDVSRIARLPITPDYFPDMHDGVVPTFGQDPSMVDKVAARVRELKAEGHQIMPVDVSSRVRPKQGD
jgi:hypothetical protein